MVMALLHTLADHLAQGVDIIGVHGHDVAVGMAVKILDGQRLHMGEHLVPQVFQRSLGDNGHHTALTEGGNHTDGIEAGRAGNGPGQTGEIVALLGEQGENVVVNQFLHKQGSLDVGQNADEDAANHNNDGNFVEFENITQNAFENLAGIFNLGARAAGAAGTGSLDNFCFFLCHYWSPPFWSKSPEPLVWLL